jgi:hypothetical protein
MCPPTCRLLLAEVKGFKSRPRNESSRVYPLGTQQENTPVDDEILIESRVGAKLCDKSSSCESAKAPSGPLWLSPIEPKSKHFRTGVRRLNELSVNLAISNGRAETDYGSVKTLPA